jgi:hypothetical protein
MKALDLGQWAANAQSAHLSWVCPECCSDGTEVHDEVEHTEEEMLLMSLEMLVSDIASSAPKKKDKAKKDKARGKASGEGNETRGREAAKVPKASKAKAVKVKPRKSQRKRAKKPQQHDFLGQPVEHAGFKVRSLLCFLFASRFAHRSI